MSDDAIVEPVGPGYYAQQPEWSDVTPSTRIQGFEHDPDAFAPMLFTPEYAEAFSFYHAVEQENTHRLFNLTTDIVNINPALYCVWATRRRLIEKLGIPVRQELDFLRTMVTENPKVYQTWNHLQFVVALHFKQNEGQCEDGIEKEFEFLDLVFNDDAKNYHAWLYVQWLVNTYNLWSHPSAWRLPDLLIQKDVRNNSAWNFRMYLLTKDPKKSLSEIDVAKELIYVSEMITKAPSNESPWIYALGLHEVTKKPEIDPTFFKFAEQLKSKGCRSRSLYAFLLDAYILHKNLKAAHLIVTELEYNIDTFRKGYWAYRREQLEKNTFS